MMYNAGQQKLLIQTYAGERKMMVYELNERDRFFSFCDFNKLEDLDFKDRIQQG